MEEKIRILLVEINEREDIKPAIDCLVQKGIYAFKTGVLSRARVHRLLNTLDQLTNEELVEEGYEI